MTVLRSLLGHLLATTLDNTKAITAPTTVYQEVLFFAGVQRDEYNSRWHLQHESRMIENANKNFTLMHWQFTWTSSSSPPRTTLR